jgi:hypothetical protein
MGIEDRIREEKVEGKQRETKFLLHEKYIYIPS